jgi:hypothetical protein
MKTLGFGFQPEREQTHFLVIIGRETVEIHQSNAYPAEDTKLKATLPRSKWNMIADFVRQVFNLRLKEKYELPTGRWLKTRPTVLGRLFGKELMTLIWGIEHPDVTEELVSKALLNWRGLAPEERWWLYTTANAATGQPKDRDTGWRKALRYALTENPVS